MGSIFGADASAKVLQFVQYAQLAQTLLTKGVGSGTAAGGEMHHHGQPVGNLVCGSLSVGSLGC